MKQILFWYNLVFFFYFIHLHFEKRNVSLYSFLHSYLPIQVGRVSFHCARLSGTLSHLMAVEPCRTYPGLHSNCTKEPTAKSLPRRLPKRGSGTELHCVELVLGTAAEKDNMNWNGTVLFWFFAAQSGQITTLSKKCKIYLNISK